jgi:GTP-binding protein YchF
MRLGIIGLPGCGKTTVFNALTKGDAPTGQSMGGRFDVLTAVVDVPDERVDVLTKMFKPKKMAYAKVTYTDIAGLQKGIGESGGISGPLLNHLATLDGFVHVVRAFEDDNIAHLENTIDAARDLFTLDMEFLFNDLVAVEGKLGRLREGLSKGAFKNKIEAETELALFERLHVVLEEERPLRELELTDEEHKALRGYSLLTLKPVLVVVNIGDTQEELTLDYPYRASLVTNLRGKLEMELAQLEGEDLEMFMEEYTVTELGLDRVISLSYELMSLQSFFTVGEDEVRAWTLNRGAVALDAAAAIHTDLAKGFIRAEIVGYDTLIELGGLPAARTAGKLRQEGKTYVMQDGDVVHVKFNL